MDPDLIDLGSLPQTTARLFHRKTTVCPHHIHMGAGRSWVSQTLINGEPLATSWASVSSSWATVSVACLSRRRRLDEQWQVTGGGHGKLMDSTAPWGFPRHSLEHV